jgi:hypothetical protein
MTKTERQRQLTRVIFKREGSRAEGFNVLAVFPREPGTYDPHTCAVYAHLGQHGSAQTAYVAGLSRATSTEYADLKRELERSGYHLDVRRRMSRADLDARRAALRQTGKEA